MHGAHPSGAMASPATTEASTKEPKEAEVESVIVKAGPPRKKEEKYDPALAGLYEIIHGDMILVEKGERVVATTGSIVRLSAEDAHNGLAAGTIKAHKDA